MDTILNTNDISLSRVLLLFYVIMASSYTSDLMGKQLKTFLKENRIAQHLISFIMMLVLIIVLGNVNDTKKALMYSVLAYLWFIFTTKLDIQWNIIIIGGLLVAFIYENNMIDKENQSHKDVNLDEKNKVKIKNDNNEIRTYVTIGIMVTTLVGLYLYLTKKEGQYGGGKFELLKFLLY